MRIVYCVGLVLLFGQGCDTGSENQPNEYGRISRSLEQSCADNGDLQYWATQIYSHAKYSPWFEQHCFNNELDTGFHETEDGDIVYCPPVVGDDGVDPAEAVVEECYDELAQDFAVGWENCDILAEMYGYPNWYPLRRYDFYPQCGEAYHWGPDWYSESYPTDYWYYCCAVVEEDGGPQDGGPVDGGSYDGGTDEEDSYDGGTEAD